MKDKLKFVKITKENIDLATEFQMSIFSSECGYKHFLISLGSQYEYFSYYLVYLESTLIGITGIYSFEPVEETNSLWLGWFGIEEKHRRLGYGKEVLLKTFDMVKDYAKKDSNIKYFRLYTSSTQNPIACNLYREIMDIEEEYNCPNDYNYEGTCLIFSKVIDSKYPMEKWNNRFLNLNRIIEQEIVGDLEYKKKKKERWTYKSEYRAVRGFVSKTHMCQSHKNSRQWDKKSTSECLCNFDWWTWRELNPRPYILQKPFYIISLFFEIDFVCNP